MGGKRGNENAQMSKEDYDAMQARNDAHDDNEGAVVTQGFQRASAETLRGKGNVALACDFVLLHLANDSLCLLRVCV